MKKIQNNSDEVYQKGVVSAQKTKCLVQLHQALVLLIRSLGNFCAVLMAVHRSEPQC